MRRVATDAEVSVPMFMVNFVLFDPCARPGGIFSSASALASLGDRPISYREQNSCRNYVQPKKNHNNAES